MWVCNKIVAVLDAIVVQYYYAKRNRGNGVEE